MNEKTKILYIGDVAVESTTGGEMLLYKLLSNHPPENLFIVQSTAPKEGYSKSKNTELKNVRYANIKYPRLYGASFRLIDHCNNWLHYLYAQSLYRRIKQIAADFQPDLIVTVGHQLLWTIALKVSKRLEKPISVIVHDDWKGTVRAPSLVRYLNKYFEDLYKASVERFTVSVYMCEKYIAEYGKTSQVLYPMGSLSRTKGSEDHRPARKQDDSLTIGYAGSLWNGYPKNIASLCNAIADEGGAVLAYTNRNYEFLTSFGLRTNNIELHSFIPVAQLLEVLERRCDILYLPMDFDSSVRINMEVAFPSKLGEYCMLGLPLIIHAPEYSSVVKWAKALGTDNFAEIVTSLNEEDMLKAYNRLKDVAYRMELGRKAEKVYSEYFHPRVSISKFYNIDLSQGPTIPQS